MVVGSTFWVTGATGRLGCELTARLEELGANVVPLVLPGYPKAPRRWPWTAAVAPVAVASQHDLGRLAAPDHVLNAHWCVNRGLGDADELVDAIDTNIRRPAFLWEWLADSGCRRFVNVSTTKVFGPRNRSPVTAGTDPRPDTGYGLAKLTGEHWFDASLHGTSVVPVHVRLCSLAAAGGHPSQLLPRLLDSAFANRPMTVNRNHEVRIAHVAEAVDLLIATAVSAEPGPIVVAPPPASVERIARLVESEAGRTLNAVYLEDEAAREPELLENTASLTSDWIRRYGLEELVAAVVAERSRRTDLTAAP